MKRKMARGGRVDRYPEEFKQTAIALVLAGGKSASPITRNLEMSENTLHNWLRLHQGKSGEAVSAKPDRGLEGLTLLLEAVKNGITP